MAVVASLVANLEANVANFTSNMDKAARSVQGLKKDIALIKFDSLVNLGSRALHATERMYAFAKSISSAANDIERMSSVMGMSIKEYQQWSYAAKMADVDQEGFITGMKFLARNIEDAKRGIGEAKDYFAAYGIQLTDVGDVSLQIASKFQAAGDSSAEAGKKIDFAMATAGRGGMAMVPLWNLGIGGIKGYMDQLVKMGGVLGDVVVKKGSEAEKQLKNIEVTINATKVSFAPWALAFAEAIDTVLKGLNQVAGVIDQMLIAQEAAGDRAWVRYLIGLKETRLEMIGLGQDITGIDEKIRKLQESWKGPGSSVAGEKAKIPLPTIGANYLGTGLNEAEFKSRMEDSKLAYEKWKDMWELPEGMEWKIAPPVKELDMIVNEMGQLEYVMKRIGDYIPVQTDAIESWAKFNEEIEETRRTLDELDAQMRIGWSEKFQQSREERAESMGIFNENRLDELNASALITADNFKKYFEGVDQFWMNTITQMSQGAMNFFSIFDNGIKGIGAGLISFGNNMLKTFQNVFSQLISNLMIYGNIMGMAGIGSGQGFGGLLGSLMPSWRKAAGGFNGTVSSPTMFLAGEAGPEQVSITPKGKGGGGGIYIETYINQIEATDLNSFEKKYEGTVKKIVRNHHRKQTSWRGGI